jgi:hypothetical protein
MAKTAPKDDGVAIIQAANIVTTTLRIRSRSPFVQNKFGQKGKAQMMAAMSTPKAARPAKSARAPRDFDQDFEQAQHKAVGGWVGIPCSAFRAAMIAACRTVNVVMTKAKMAVFIVADGFDADDGTPLVRLQSAAPPERTELPVRNDNGSADIRVRPMWREWWADVTIEFDADMITAESVINLLDRAGRQVGVGEGRPFSKNSVGMGWGTFTVEPTAKEHAA